VKRQTIRRVPLHSLANGSRLRSRITNVPILSNNLCESMPLTSKVLRNSHCEASNNQARPITQPSQWVEIAQ
jgi:leucyl-tRNA synthetase